MPTFDIVRDASGKPVGTKPSSETITQTSVKSASAAPSSAKASTGYDATKPYPSTQSKTAIAIKSTDTYTEFYDPATASTWREPKTEIRAERIILPTGVTGSEMGYTNYQVTNLMTGQKYRGSSRPPELSVSETVGEGFKTTTATVSSPAQTIELKPVASPEKTDILSVLDRGFTPSAQEQQGLYLGVLPLKINTAPILQQQNIASTISSGLYSGITGKATKPLIVSMPSQTVDMPKLGYEVTKGFGTGFVMAVPSLLIGLPVAAGQTIAKAGSVFTQTGGGLGGLGQGLAYTGVAVGSAAVAAGSGLAYGFSEKPVYTMGYLYGGYKALDLTFKGINYLRYGSKSDVAIQYGNVKSISRAEGDRIITASGEDISQAPINVRVGKLQYKVGIETFKGTSERIGEGKALVDQEMFFNINQLKGSTLTGLGSRYATTTGIATESITAQGLPYWYFKGQGMTYDLAKGGLGIPSKTVSFTFKPFETSFDTGGFNLPLESGMTFINRPYPLDLTIGSKGLVIPPITFNPANVGKITVVDQSTIGVGATKAGGFNMASLMGGSNKIITDLTVKRGAFDLIDFNKAVSDGGQFMSSFTKSSGGLTKINIPSAAVQLGSKQITSTVQELFPSYTSKPLTIPLFETATKTMTKQFVMEKEAPITFNYLQQKYKTQTAVKTESMLPPVITPPELKLTTLTTQLQIGLEDKTILEPPIQKLITKTVTTEKPPVPIPIMPTGLITPAWTILPPIPNLTGGGAWNPQRAFMRKRQKFAYAPSLTAIMFNIRGKKPSQKIFTGFEIRPMLKRK